MIKKSFSNANKVCFLDFSHYLSRNQNFNRSFIQYEVLLIKFSQIGTIYHNTIAWINFFKKKNYNNTKLSLISNKLRMSASA